MWWKKSQEQQPESQSNKWAANLQPSLEALAYGINTMDSIRCTKIRCQGQHPVTGGTSVVYFELPRTDSNYVRLFLNEFFYGRPRPDVSDFLRRVKEKVTGGYAIDLEISGSDAEGDSIYAKFKFPSQAALEHIAEHGLFKLADNPNAANILMIGGNP